MGIQKTPMKPLQSLSAHRTGINMRWNFCLRWNPIRVSRNFLSDSSMCIDIPKIFFGADGLINQGRRSPPLVFSDLRKLLLKFLLSGGLARYQVENTNWTELSFHRSSYHEYSMRSARPEISNIKLDSSSLPNSDLQSQFWGCSEANPMSCPAHHQNRESLRHHHNSQQGPSIHSARSHRRHYKRTN